MHTFITMTNVVHRDKSRQTNWETCMHLHAYINTCTPTHMYVHMHMLMHSGTHTHTHRGTHTHFLYHTHTKTNTHTHTHTHTHTSEDSKPNFTIHSNEWDQPSPLTSCGNPTTADSATSGWSSCQWERKKKLSVHRTFTKQCKYPENFSSILSIW